MLTASTEYVSGGTMAETASIEEGRTCKDDGDCSSKQYCYDVSGRCVDYTLCKHYNRQEAQSYSRHPAQCGPCLPGYTAELLGTGNTESLCKKTSFQEDITDYTTLPNETIYLITGVSVSCLLVLLIIFGIVIVKYMKRNKQEEGKCKNFNQVCVFDPSAPPPEQSPFIPFEESTSVAPFDNNQNLKDKNTLVKAAPFKPPSWIRMNPDYGHHLSTESLQDTEQQHDSVPLPREEESSITIWNPEQLAVDMPNRSMSEFATENRDNAMNAVLVQRNYTTPPRSENDTNGSTSDTNNGQTNHNRSTTQNVSINPQITMHVNVHNRNC